MRKNISKVQRVIVSFFVCCGMFDRPIASFMGDNSTQHGVITQQQTATAASPFCVCKTECQIRSQRANTTDIADELDN